MADDCTGLDRWQDLLASRIGDPHVPREPDWEVGRTLVMDGTLYRITAVQSDGTVTLHRDTDEGTPDA